MLVKCIAVHNERTPKKVEVILSRVIPAQKNVVKINARIARLAVDESIDDVIDDVIETDETAVEDVIDTAVEDISDNLEGITPVIEYYTASDDDDVSVSEPEDDIDIEDLENDLLSLITSDLGEEYDEPAEEEAVPERDDEIIQRHFIRGDTGELFMSDSEEAADGHEVACYDNEGKLKRACGVIRKGSPAALVEDNDDVFSRAVNDMFLSSDN